MPSLKFYLAKLVRRLKIADVLDTDVHPTSKICYGTHIHHTKIDRYSYIAPDTAVVNAEIGAFTSIASGCIIGGGAHPTDWVSSSPVFYKGKNSLKKNFSDNEFTETKRTVIGNDVWIGSRCLIKSGVKIGDGAVIGMGAVVTHDVEPYSIVGGNPARLIRWRFDDDIIEKLQKTEWFNMAESDLKKYGPYFNDPERFIEEWEKNNK